ncbi:hypothetical protein SVAN01_06542 [Stagonosporopsis vannaccii]|nr:hypothetical protein SVAN01_06542 [Stagonosporopsis vannaccii]
MAFSDGKRPSASATSYLVHHVVFPPQLPQADDFDALNELCLLDTTIIALNTLKPFVTAQYKSPLAQAITTIDNLRRVRDKLGNVTETDLRKLLEELANGKNQRSVPLEIKAQNAGILITSDGKDITFEVFELSPENKYAMLKGRLVRTFPGLAASIPVVKMQEQGLQKMLADTLAKMSTQTAPGFQPVAYKAGRNHDEERDTTHPGMVADYFLNVIAALGKTVTVTRIMKRTREDVLWNNCKQPWRRSPLWLLVRVTLQLLFTRQGPEPSTADGLYKVFMVQFLSIALGYAQFYWDLFGSSYMHVIEAKMLRRVRKLEALSQLDCVVSSWIDSIQTCMTDASAYMDEKWSTEIQDTGLNLATAVLSSLQPDNALDVSLPDLDDLLATFKSRTTDATGCDFEPGPAFPHFTSVPRNFAAAGDHQYFGLAAVEKWVGDHLQDWLQAHRTDETTCRQLYELMTTYHNNASKAYEKIPWCVSVMCLTILEIWVACDDSACSLFPLLKTYDPEVQLFELQCLTLPFRSQMQRLLAVETYVQSRRRTATNTTSVFRDFGVDSSFGVQHFRQSPELQRVLQQVEQKASKQHAEQCKKLTRLKSKYNDLMKQYNSAHCDYVEITYNRFHNYKKNVHSRNCDRCALKAQADNLEISIYEWPVSSNKSNAQATIFELRIPASYSAWRDASAFIISDVLGCKSNITKRPQFKYTLRGHQDLKHLLEPGSDLRRIVPLSEIKPHWVTHRRNKKAVQHLEESDVSLQNGLRYQFFDSTTGTFTAAQAPDGKLPRSCTLRLPARSQSLDRCLQKPPSAPDGIPPNEVVASLSECPSHFSLEEYKAFGTLSLGRNIFYSNILTQLAMPTLDFSKVETQCLVQQTITQVGLSNGSVERTNHHVLSDPILGVKLIENIKIAAQRGEENWESWRAMATFIQLACRVHNLTGSSEVRDNCLEFLHKARRISLTWLHRLRTRAASSTNDTQRSELSSRATEIALLGTTTFDVETQFLDAILQQQDSVSSLLQFSIAVQENKDLIPGTEALQKSALQAWRSVMYRIFTKLSSAILHDSSGINQAVLQSWAAFQPAENTFWSKLSDSHPHWLHIISSKLPVHINLLTGQLLVSGLPLTRLPSEYLSHPMYKPLFSAAVLEVVPTDEPGMRFSAKSTYHGHKLHFGMAAADMQIVAMCQGNKFDLIPARVFADRMPQAFTRDYIHWYNYGTEEIEFIPRDAPWQLSDMSQWHLHRHGKSWRLRKGSQTLLDMKSKCARMISSLFTAVEDAPHIHISHDTASQMVSVELPRLKLDFHIKNGEHFIHSRQYRGMVLDEDQRIGTLIGLSSKLVLRRLSTTNDRLVLIPEGALAFYKTRTHHVSVSVSRQKNTIIHAYQLDNTLGRVLDSGAMQSKLLLCLLHALTSHWLPDPLTRYTGTEAALNILRSSAVHSFSVLSSENAMLLNKIAALSPSRAFYPQYERVMQQIVWDSNLPFSSQHGDFHVLVNDIFEHDKKMSLFHLNNISQRLHRHETTSQSAINSDLQARANIRSATFHVAGFGAEHFHTKFDTTYKARDRQANSERGQRAFLAASMLVRDKASLDQSIAQFNIYRDHFQNENGVRGLESADEPLVLRYDSKWLDSPSPLVRDLWCTVHRHLVTKSAIENKFDILSWLSTMAYASKVDMDVVRAFVAFYRIPELASIQIPSKSLYNLSEGSSFKINKVELAARAHAMSYDDSSEAWLPKVGSETDAQHLRRIESLFKDETNTAVHTFVTIVKNQWPCEQPSTPSSDHINKYLDTSSAMIQVTNSCRSWYNNSIFEQYFKRICSAVQNIPSASITIPQFDALTPYDRSELTPEARYCNFNTIFGLEAPSVSGNATNVDQTSRLIASQGPALVTVPNPLPIEAGVTDRLAKFCEILSKSAESTCEKRYVDNLRASCDSLQRNVDDSNNCTILVDACARDAIRQHLSACEEHFEALRGKLDGVLVTETTRSNVIASCIQLSPRLSPSFWLGQLKRECYDSLLASWPDAMIAFALSITNLQRAQRLVAVLDKPVELNEELQHTGHTNWNPRDHPETLLLEAESGILVRKVQAAIAARMIQPPGARNTVMQLNMGEGKSSTIVPIVAAALADKAKLVRVIVAKPQSRQMLEMLVAKLGGLLDRRVYHMPFSRDLQLTEADVQTIGNMYQDCMARRGVLLVQPEHILSFKLMGIECLASKKPRVGQLLLDTEQWFKAVSRDIVDESDENFSVKFELIYTMGVQGPIGFAPDRWLLIQEVLALIPRLAAQVLLSLPLSVEVQHDTDGRFPRVRILSEEGAESLLALLVEQIVKNGLTGLPICNQPEGIRQAIKQYISDLDLPTELVGAVEQSQFWTESTEEPLLLVRGLIAGGVLRFALSQKRWRVNYGLDLTRVPHTPLAVPYKAKDCPSPRSEFSHPDVVILLTQLSYYYGGLQDEELFDAFNHLLKSDQSTIHYDEWVRTAAHELPAAFRQLSGVSIKDRVLCVEQIFPHLRYSRCAINYYLAFLVFPKAMKEFPSKLSASGWDLGAVKTHPITGFSGTNDTLHVLPLAVKHLDLPSQSHTNALVLNYLLQEETSVEKLLPRSGGSDAEHLLTVINNLQPEVRVVLDVGAQILEMDNTQVAQCWLAMRKNDRTEAVVFFKDEELSVLDVHGRIEHFQTSPFAKQLDRCLVYLDEAHTRGTDLKLPRDYRAAVTLGANLTKDRLVQACMRMRKLGKGQSVVFLASQEMCTKICARSKKKLDEPITVTDVLCWSIGETWLDLSRSMPLWAVQGHRYETHKHLLEGAATTISQAEKFLEDEAQSIHQRYAPTDKGMGHHMFRDLDDPSVQQIYLRCQEFQVMGFNSATLQEEQERELSPEIEEERQIERPHRMAAEAHKILADLQHLVNTGDLIPGSPAFEPAFQALRSTSAGKHYRLAQLPKDLLVTKDFMRTVKIRAGSSAAGFVSDSFQRPVQWVLSVVDEARTDTIKHLVIVSPFEANELYFEIIKHKKVTLHLFAPRFNASFAPLDKLELFNVGRAFEGGSVPQSLTLQLNLFAGSLYIRSLAEYEAVCDFLGLLRGTAGPRQRVSADGFVDPPIGKWRLKKSPVQFLRGLLMKIRKEGEGVEKTHMGRLLGGVRLEECDFEPEAPQTETRAGAPVSVAIR